MSHYNSPYHKAVELRTIWIRARLEALGLSQWDQYPIEDIHIWQGLWCRKGIEANRVTGCATTAFDEETLRSFDRIVMVSKELQ